MKYKVFYREYNGNRVYINHLSPTHESYAPYYYSIDYDNSEFEFLEYSFKPICNGINREINAVELKDFGYSYEELENKESTKEIRCSTLPIYVSTVIEGQDPINYWEKYCSFNPNVSETDDVTAMLYGTIFHSIIEKDLKDTRDNKGKNKERFTSNCINKGLIGDVIVITEHLVNDIKEASEKNVELTDKANYIKEEIKNLKDEDSKLNKNLIDKYKEDLKELKKEIVDLRKLLVLDYTQWIDSTAEKTTRSTAMYKKTKKLFNEYMGTNGLEVIKQKELEFLIDTYFINYRRPIINLIFYDEYELIGTEITFRIEDYLGFGFNLKGTIDIILRNKVTGKVIIVDTKTSAKSKTIEDFNLLSTKNSAKMYQAYLYADLLIKNSKEFFGYSLQEEDIAIMFLPCYLTKDKGLLNPQIQNDIKTGIDYMRKVYNSYINYVKEFVHFGCVIRKPKEILEIKKPKLEFNDTTIDDLAKSSFYLETLAIESGIKDINKYIFHLENGVKVYKYELYLAISHNLGYKINIVEHLSNQNFPNVKMENGIYNISMETVNTESPIEVIGIYGFVKDNKDNIITYDYFSNQDLERHVSQFSEEILKSLVWTEFKKQMRFKTIVKHLMNKTFLHTGDYEIVDLLIKHENKIFELVKR